MQDDLDLNKKLVTAVDGNLLLGETNNNVASSHTAVSNCADPVAKSLIVCTSRSIVMRTEW